MDWRADLLSHDLEPDNDFGYAVGISGDIVAVGAPIDDLGPSLPSAGSVDLFRHEQGQWNADVTLFENPSKRGARFGFSLMFASDALLIGAPYSDEYDDTGIQASGRAYVYRHLAAWYDEQTFAPTDEREFGLFGRSVHLTDQLALVGRFWGSHAYGFLNVAHSHAYGDGWPGLTGVPPAFALETAPLLGERVHISIANSSLTKTTAAMLVGIEPVALPTLFGGTLNVIPRAVLLFSLPSGGLQFSRNIPADSSLDGADLYAQVLEIDAGASHGMSFSRGLRATLGTVTCDS